MRILFLHPNFPAQFRHLATVLGREPKNQVFFGTTSKQGNIAGVNKVNYQPSREPSPQTHQYVRNLENAVIQGQAVYRIGQQLKSQGFEPDVVYAHSGWGPGLFIKDIFPKTKYYAYFEWFYHAHGSDADFNPAEPLDADAEARIRIKNAAILLDLVSCDRALSRRNGRDNNFLQNCKAKSKFSTMALIRIFSNPIPSLNLFYHRLI